MAEKRIRCWVEEFDPPTKTIYATMIDGEGEEFSITLSLDMVAKGDLHLVQPGAYFDIVGDLDSRQDAHVEFSREVWTKEDIERGKAKAKEWAYMFEKKEGDDEDVQGHS